MFEVANPKEVLKTFIVKQAEKYKVEGVGQQMQNGLVQLYVCSQEELVEEFIDSLYVGDKKIALHNIMIETCPTDRSYRGVFRIVE